MRSKAILPLFLLCVGAISLAIGWYYFAAGDSPHHVSAEDPVVPAEPKDDEDLPGQPLVPAIQNEGHKAPKSSSEKQDSNLGSNFYRAGTTEARLAALEQMVQGDATSLSLILWDLIEIEEAGPTNLKALDVAVEIAATRETPEDVSRVILRAMTCRSVKIRRRAMVHAKDHPHYSLVDALLRVVDLEPANRSLAMTALAYHEQQEAQQCLFDFAGNEDARQQDRGLAITLLSVHRPDGTLDLLADLSDHDDEGVRAAANQVLRSWND